MIPATMSAASHTTPSSPNLGGEQKTGEAPAAEPQGHEDSRKLPEHHEAAPTPPEKGGKKLLDGKPESVQLLLQVMAGAIALEFIHQIFSFILAVLNFEVLKATARQTVGEESELSGTMVTLTAWGSLALTTIISLTIIGILAWMLWLLNKKSKHAGTARRMLFVFSLYFTFRLFLVFVTRPTTGSDAPDWLYVFDGSLQILVGVAAILVLVFSSREETLEYTGEMEKLRQMEKEQKERQEQRARELKEKNEKNSSGKGSKKVQDEQDYGTFKGMLNRWRKNDKNSDKGDKKDSDKKNKRDRDKDSK